MSVGRRVDELGRDPQVLPRLADAPLQDVTDVDRTRDLRDGLLRAFERHRRASRYDQELPDMGKVRDDLLGHPVAEVFLAFLGADVGEGEDDDGFVGDGKGGSKGLDRSLDAPCGR